MDEIGQSSPQYFTTLHLQSGFHQMELHPESRDKTGFLTHTSNYIYKRLPQGLRNSPIFFPSLMDIIFKGVKFPKMMVYLDDLMVFSKTFKDYLQHLREVFTCLRKSGLKLKPSKCYFARRKTEFLGHVLSQKESLLIPKTSALSTYPTPKPVTQLRRFLGTVSFHRRFVKSFSQIARPLHQLTCKQAKFGWTPECPNAFDTMRKAVTSNAVLVYPNFQKEFILATDASTQSIGATQS